MSGVKSMASRKFRPFFIKLALVLWLSEYVALFMVNLTTSCLYANPEFWTKFMEYFTVTFFSFTESLMIKMVTKITSKVMALLKFNSKVPEHELRMKEYLAVLKLTPDGLNIDEKSVIEVFLKHEGDVDLTHLHCGYEKVDEVVETIAFEGMANILGHMMDYLCYSFKIRTRTVRSDF